MVSCPAIPTTYSNISLGIGAAYSISSWILIHQLKADSDILNENSKESLWDDYKYGFGISTGNYWLGNEKVHQLTSSGKWKLRVEVRGFVNRKWYSAEYTTFTLASEADKYRINVGGYTGDAGDGFNVSPQPDGVSNGMPFTNADINIDYYNPFVDVRSNNSRSLCAAGFGAWWWNNCGTSALTIPGGWSMWGTLNLTVQLPNYYVVDSRMMISTI